MNRVYKTSRGGPGTTRSEPPQLSIYANPKYDASITTWAAYLTETTRKIEAYDRVILAGSDYLQEQHAWNAVEAAVGVRNYTYVDQLVSNSDGLPLIYQLNPIQDGVRKVPASLTATAWDHSSMTTAYKNTLTDLHNSHMGSQLWILQVGCKVDEYFVTNPSEIAAYATFLASVITHAHTLWTASTFFVSCGVRHAAVVDESYSELGTLAAIRAQVDVHAFYYTRLGSPTGIHLDQIDAAIPASDKFYFDHMSTPSSTAVGASEAIQQTTLATLLSQMNGFNSVQGTTRCIAATLHQLNDVSAAVMTSYGTPAGSEQDYAGSIGFIDTGFEEKDVWVPLVTLLEGDPGITGDPPPGMPTLIAPADGAISQALFVSIRASATAAQSYSIRIGTVNPPTEETFLGAVGQYTPSVSLLHSTTYYHQWIAHNTGGDTVGPVWSFTTQAAVSVSHPKLLITPEYRAIMAQMKADYDAAPSAPATLGGKWYKWAVDVVAYGLPGPQGFIASNSQVFAAWLYQATGDPAYAQAAFTFADAPVATRGFLHMVNNTTSPNSNNYIGGNQSREYFITWVLTYDWCYNAWTQAQRDQYLTQLNACATELNVQLPEAIGDVDQPIGDYFGMLCLHEATKDYNPHIVTKFSDVRWGAPQMLTTPAAEDYDSTTRIILWRYYNEYVDGYWPEGSEYSEGSARLGILGLACLRTTEVASYFPEVEAYAIGRANFMLHETAPNNTVKPQWGDDEYPRQLKPATNLYCTFPMLTGFLGDTPLRSQVWKKFLDVSSVAGQVIFSSQFQPIDKSLLMVDPYTIPAANLDNLPLQRFHETSGLLFRRTGSNAMDSHFFAHTRTEVQRVDHGVLYQGNYQLYRRGEWIWTGPVAYFVGGVRERPAMAAANNCFATEGLTFLQMGNKFPRQYNVTTMQKSGTNYEIVGSTRGGSMYSSGYQPPPRYVHEASRCILYVTTPNKTMDMVIVLDRINAVDPESLERFTRYDSFIAGQQAAITANPRWESFMQQRVLPTFAAGVGTWTTAGGQLCRDVWLSPAVPSSVTALVQDLSNTTLNPNPYPAAERKWRTRFTPVSNTQWNPLLYVRSVRNSGVSAPVETLLTVTDDGIGCHVTRSGNTDVAFIGNAIQGPDITPLYPTEAECVAVLEGVTLRTTGYSTTITVVGSSCDLYLVHLNPLLTWTISVNGAISSLAVDADGVAVVSLVGAGAKTIIVDTV